MSSNRPAFALDLPHPWRDARSRSRRNGIRSLFSALPPGRRRARPWGLLGSGVFHGVIVGVVVLMERLPQESAAKAAPSAPVAHRAITLMYLPTEAERTEKEVSPKPRPVPTPRPPEAIPPQPREAEAAPPPSPAEASPVSDLNPAGMTPHELTTVPEHDEPVAMVRERGAPAGAAGTRDELMVSEAQRLFGRPGAPQPPGGDGMLGPIIRAGRPIYLPAGGRRCLAGGPAAAVPSAGVFEGVVAGVVRHQSTGAVLPGAYLQILGTPYSTFADDRGRYRLTFDPTLVGPCRTQVVRVMAPGYRAQNLILAVGSADNTILMTRR